MPCRRSLAVLAAAPAVAACQGAVGGDSGAVDGGPVDGGAVVDAAGDGCPAGWICPSTPLYRSKIGIWYATIWRPVEEPGSFPWAVSREPASPAPGSDAPRYLDTYGDEVPDLYLQIASGYANLRTGFMPGVVYRDNEEGAPMVRVVGGAFVEEVAPPRGQPVIVVPPGTIAALR